jgi:two-component system C4-dicarboxylate transport sensor histidine kinase DctB
LKSDDRQLKIPDELELVLSVLRHELGNSVNALKITLDVLRENYDTFGRSKKKEYLERAAQLIGRQQETVQALKMYSMFSVEDRKPISFSAFWTQLLPLVTRRLEERQVRMITRYESIVCTICGNLAALNKVVLSVVDNALDALEGSSNPTIEIYTAGGSSEVRIGIRDNGTGCRPEDVEKLFVPLFTTRPGKTGMGLAIARKLTSEMNGDIVMKSSPNAGSEVVVRFSTLSSDDPSLQCN